MSRPDRSTLRSKCDSNGIICPRSVAAELQIDLPTLALALGASDNELLENQPLTAAAEHRLEFLVDLLERTLDRSGSFAAAWQWASDEPIPSFGGQTAMELIREDRGPAVIAHIERINAGGYA